MQNLGITFLFTYLCLSFLFKKSKIVEDAQDLCFSFIKDILSNLELDNLKKKINSNVQEKNNDSVLSKVDKVKEANAENRMRYQFKAQQMDTIKGHQWSMTYYALLVFAGIVGITKIISKNGNNNDSIFLYLGIILIIFSTFTIVFIIFMMSKYQNILIFIRGLTIELEQKFVTYKDIRKSSLPHGYFKYWFQGYILLTFIISIIVGYIFSVGYIIYKLII